MTAFDTRAAAARAVAFYEALSPADVARIGDVYAPDAWFRDPFNEVRGVAQIQVSSPACSKSSPTASSRSSPALSTRAARS